MGFIYGIKLNFQGNLPKTYFLTSWLRQQSECPGQTNRGDWAQTIVKAGPCLLDMLRPCLGTYRGLAGGAPYTHPR